MSPDDPRHGTRAGYIAGCRADCCRDPHLRYQKASNLRRHRYGGEIVPAAPCLDFIARWAEQGVTRNALAAAAGLGDGTLAEMTTGQRDVCLRSTRDKLLGVTESDLSPNAYVFADLTRTRIYSLMACGHSIEWICDRAEGLSRGGRWRYQQRVTVRVAHSVRDLYRTAPALGDNNITRGKARGRGALHPFAWDDPGTLAWPSTDKRTHGGTSSHTKREAFNSERLDRVRELDDMHATLDEVCARLGIGLDGLWKWASRHGHLDLYDRIARRTRVGINQHIGAAGDVA
jgi:hypothetical protein